MLGKGHHLLFKLTRILAFLLTILGLMLLTASAFQNATLTWNPSASTNVAGYNIHYGGASGSYTNELFLGRVTNTTIPGLLEGSTYFFMATATDALGFESDPSPEISYSVPTNAAPTLDPISDLTIVENAAAQTVFLSGITSGASNQALGLVVTATSSNPSLVSAPGVTYTSPNTTGSLTFAPAPNSFGVATITVTVNNGYSQNNTISRSFTLTVNQPPSISPIPNQITAVNIATAPIPFTISDAATPASNLTVVASCTNSVLVADTGIVLGGSDSNRTVTLIPSPGQTGDAQITITASDGIGSASASFLLSVFSSVLKTGPNLTLATKGGGKILTSSSTLLAGKTYTFSAVPAAGQEFAGWAGATNWTGSSVHLLLTSNLLLEAVFIPSPFIPIMGTYGGLFYEADRVRQNSAGCFNVLATRHGLYSGRLQIGSTRRAFTGRLDLQCEATNLIMRLNESALQVELHFGNGDQAGQIFGRVTDGSWASSLSGERAVFNSLTNPAPFAGSYTVVVPGGEDDPSFPASDSFATVRVSASGAARLSGRLADGTIISQGVPLFRDGLWPFYVSLYFGSGSLTSWLAVTNRIGDDLNGALSWIKPANPLARYYPAGFSNECNVIGSIYLPPPSATNHILSVTNTIVAFTGGNLGADFTNSIALGLGSHVTDLSSNRLALSFSLPSGAFTGTVVDPETGKAFPFRGAVFQKLNAGYGFLAATNQSSRVLLNP